MFTVQRNKNEIIVVDRDGNQVFRIDPHSYLVVSFVDEDGESVYRECRYAESASDQEIVSVVFNAICR